MTAKSLGDDSGTIVHAARHSMPADGNYRVRPKGMYPFVDGLMHAELLPPRGQVELTAADRNYQTPYVGVTTDGTPQPGLYTLEDTGISHRHVVDAARTYLHALRPHLRTCLVHPVESDNWRRWTNAFPTWAPKGVRLGMMTESERQAALDLVEASLSPEGFRAVRDGMRLNAALGEIVDDYNETLTEFSYWMTIFGQPSETEPWGWQLMGHHVDVNCIFVGSQQVIAPVFLGAEPVAIDKGPYAGIHMFDPETARGLEMRRSFDDAQATAAVLSPSILNADLPEELNGPFNGRHLTGAGQDNLVMPYEGVNAAELSVPQQDLLMSLIDLYLLRWPAEHRKRKHAQVVKHLDDTHFAWRGQHDDTAAFYYRVHSPVLSIEYDNHPGIFLEYDEPQRWHVHTIVREPNGNDYGKSLLSQHYEKHHS